MLGLRAVRVCDACVDAIRAQQNSSEPLCVRCGDALGMESARFAGSFGSGECTLCRTTPPAFIRAVSFGAYDNELRELLQALKFHGLRRLSEALVGEWLATAICQLEGDAASNLVVIPVPLFRNRERRRGFNQSELLARSALKHLRKLRPTWAFTLEAGVLSRVRDTRPQFALGAAQRETNLKGAFRVEQPERIQSREVLLVDDILTSGATANTCSRALLRAGATKVWVATVARARPESVHAVEAGVALWQPPVRDEISAG